MPRWTSIFLMLPAGAAWSGYAGLPAEGAWVGKSLCLLLLTGFLALGVLSLPGAKRGKARPPACGTSGPAPTPRSP